MHIRKILCPTDFSPASDAAFEFAATLARQYGASLLIVHVQEPPAAYQGVQWRDGAIHPNREDLEAALRKIEPPFSEVDSQYHLLAGDAAESIVRLAQEQEADLIVLGTQGRTGLAGVLMGSVAEAVVRQSPLPVLTCKHSLTAKV